MSNKTSIWIPREMIKIIQEGSFPRERNPCICVKIPYRGYEISLSLDSSHTTGDLSRSDIRVYLNEVNLTEAFHEKDHSMIYGDAESIRRVMNQIDKICGEN